MNENLWYYIGITPTGALAAFLATIAMYLLFVGMVRLWWRHIGVTRSSFQIALAAVLGAIAGRSMLGETPTIAGGIIVLTTLLALEGAVGWARNAGRMNARRSGGVIVMRDGNVDNGALRKLAISEHDLWVSLRQHGVRGFESRGAVIVEHNGALTVLTEATPIDRRLLAGVLGAESLPDELVTD